MPSSALNDNSRYWLVVPAAGIGTRMGSVVPKQYLPLGDKTLLEQTLTRLLQLSFYERLILVLHPKDHWWQTLPLSKDQRICVVTGGEQRSHSVLNALQSLTGIAKENDWVLVHDAARPCIAPSSITKLCAEVSMDSVGGILGVPVSDTLKSVAEGHILTTIDRNKIWQAQTPQIFRYGLLLSCLERALSEAKAITDEASAIEAYGHRPLMVVGRSDNIKITHAEDLLLADWILQQQGKFL